jgi:DNA-binding NarL/FixJ family response regulator
MPDMTTELENSVLAVRTLPPRQREMLCFLGQGFQKKEISERLGISLKTVEHHCERLYLHLAIHNSREAVRIAFHAQLV